MLDCHTNQTRILSKEYSFVAGDYVRSTARNYVKCHIEDNSPKYRMVGNDVGLESPTYRSFKFWYRDFCSSLRANAKQSRETVITRSEKRRSNLIHIEKDEIATFRCTPLAMTDNRLRNKCAMTSVGDMKENNFFDKVHSLFTSHLSLKSAAFTLAEVLVTLGIIGVVSAMTVPTLMQNYQRQSYITQLHKVYNEVQQGALRYMTDRNAINLMEAGLTNSAAMQEFLRDNFKIVSMGTTDSDMPWNNVSYKNLNGGSWTSGTWGCGPCAVLASGAWVCADNPKCYTYSYGGHTSWYGMFFVDINGKKGPNIIGRDTFLMELWSDGVLDLPKVSPACRTLGVCDGDSIEAIRNTGTACEGSTTYTHQRCFANILNNNWEMNY